MLKRDRLLDRKINKQYPWLAYKNWKDQSDKYLSHYYDMPRGWVIAFGKLLVSDIDKELKRCRFTGEFTILQIKEKYGELRFYHGGVPRDCDVDPIIENYTTISRRTCIQCGKFPVAIVNTGGWIEPMCEECFKRIYSGLDYKASVIEDGEFDPISRWKQYRKDGEAEEIIYDCSPIIERMKSRYD